MNFKGFVFGKKTPEENLKLIETQSQQIVDDLRGLQEKINALPSAQSVGNYLSVIGDKPYSLDTVNCTNGDLLFLDKQKAKAQTTPASGLHVAYADEATHADSADTADEATHADSADTADDADTLDGYNSGNSTGRIPISNGTVCTNLNADMVDGVHAASFALLSENLSQFSTVAVVSTTFPNYGASKTVSYPTGFSVSNCIILAANVYATDSYWYIITSDGNYRARLSSSGVYLENNSSNIFNGRTTHVILVKI